MVDLQTIRKETKQKIEQCLQKYQKRIIDDHLLEEIKIEMIKCIMEIYKKYDVTFCYDSDFNITIDLTD